MDSIARSVLDEDRDRYAMLGVQPSASLPEIKAAYRALARRYHPDLNPQTEAAEEIKAVNAAYTFLCERHAAGLGDRNQCRTGRSDQTAASPVMGRVVQSNAAYEAFLEGLKGFC